MFGSKSGFSSSCCAVFIKNSLAGFSAGGADVIGISVVFGFSAIFYTFDTGADWATYSVVGVVAHFYDTSD